MNNSYKLCTVFGIPIRVHVTLLLLFPLMLLFLSGNMGKIQSVLPMNPYLYALFLMLGLFASISIHELGHSLVGIRCGYKIKDITLLPIGGVAQISRMTSSNLHELLVAIAGPVVSLVLAFCLYLISLVAVSAHLVGLYVVAIHLVFLNLVLAVFNLIPAFPMDGGRVLRAALTPHYGRLEATRKASKTGQTLAMIFGIFSLLQLHIWNMVIAIFIYRLAAAEYRTMLMREAYSRRFGWGGHPPPNPANPPLDLENEIEVGPPPYETNSVSDSTFRNIRRMRDKIRDALNYNQERE